MKVKEWINKLQEYDQEAELMIVNSCDEFTFDELENIDPIFTERNISICNETDDILTDISELEYCELNEFEEEYSFSKKKNCNLWF